MSDLPEIDEVGRQVDIWCAASRNISELNKKIAVMDAQRADECEKLDNEIAVRDRAAMAVQELVKDIDEDSAAGAEVKAILSDKVASVFIEEMVS